MIAKCPDSAAFAIEDKVTLSCDVKIVAEVIRKDLNYLWFKEGSGVIDKTGKSIELSLLKLSVAGEYSCKVTCGDLNVESNHLIINVDCEVHEVPFCDFMLVHLAAIKIEYDLSTLDVI